MRTFESFSTKPILQKIHYAAVSYIERFQTSGTVVSDVVVLSGESVHRDNFINLRITPVSPNFLSSFNYVTLSIFNSQKDDYESVQLAWGSDRICIVGDYVVKGFYRVTQEYNGRGDIRFTFYNFNDDYLIELLRKIALGRLKSNATSQQKEPKQLIIKQSGLLADEIKDI